MNNNYRLQVRHHSEMFDSRESALEYIYGTFKYDSLIGEPAIFLYGEKDTKKPNVMLAFGAGDKKFALIDIANVEEKTANLENVTSLTQKDLEETTKVLMSAIDACGLTFDSNKINDKVSFEPDIKDVVLREAKTITEALALLSQYTQEHVKNKNITTKDTKSVTLSYVPMNDGMELSAVVNISVYGDSDENDFNNNIIGVKDDGLYATSNLEYDADKHTLTFTSSGMKNGRFQDDANKKVIELGKHSVYTESNDGHNIEIKINKIDAFNSTVSADVKISEDVNNIFTTQDGKLFVDGRASNIKYGQTTVADELTLQNSKLDNLSNALQEVIDDSVIKGVSTETTTVSAEKGLSGEGYVVKSDVLLSNDKSIKVSEGGLSVNIDVKVDTHNNKLFVNVGNRVIEQDLPGVNLIDNIVYDQTAKNIVITFDNGKVATIPVDDLLNDYTFNNFDDQPVVIETSNNVDGSINVATRLNLRSTDNILAVENGMLFAPQSLIENSVSTETKRAEASEKQLQENIDAVSAVASNNTQSIVSLNEKVVSVEKDIAILNGTIDTKGSIMQIVTHSAEDTILSANTYTDTVANTKANTADVYTKSEIDGKGFLTEHQDISHLATKEDVNKKADADNVYTKYDIDTKGLAYQTDVDLKANRNDVYSKSESENIFVTKVDADGKFATQTTLSSLEVKVDNIDLSYDTASNVITFFDGNATKTFTLNSNAVLQNGTYDEINKAIVLELLTQDKEVKFITIPVSDLVSDFYSITEINEKFATIVDLNKKANADNVYTKEEIQTSFATIEKMNLKADADNVYTIKQVDDLMLTKANVVDVYTKDQIDGKGYLTEHQDISHLATKDVVLTTEQAASLYLTKTDAQITYSTINTVNELNNKLENVNLIYVPERNVLVFNDGNGETEFVLSGHTALVEGKYENGYIILTVATQDGNTNQIKFSVESLVSNIYTDDEVDAKISELNDKFALKADVLDLENIINTKIDADDVKDILEEKNYLVKEDIIEFITKDEVAKDYIAIDKAISRNANNAIELDMTGALYASNRANTMYTQWSDRGQTSIITVEEAIGLLKTNLDAINFATINDDISNIQDSIAVLETAFNKFKTDTNTQLSSLVERLDALEASVSKFRKTDPDVATALSVLTGEDVTTFVDDKATLDDKLENSNLSVNMGEY